LLGQAAAKGRHACEEAERDVVAWLGLLACYGVFTATDRRL
jgi:hypothetical protein